MTTLPSFNDFSVGILRLAQAVSGTQVPDLRKILKVVADHEGEKAKSVAHWRQELFKGVKKRSIVKALVSNGLVHGDEWKLTDVGNEILNQSSAESAIQIFARQLLVNCNGQLIIDAVSSLVERGEPIQKDTLQEELESFGVEGLSNATTDHTNHLKWLIKAGVVQDGPVHSLNDGLIKPLVGISGAERLEYQSLPLSQQIFLSVTRRVIETDRSGEWPVKPFFDECLRDYKRVFKPAQLSQQVLKPLENGGWITLKRRSGSSSGGKSGVLQATQKLLDIPITALVPDFDAVIPADLRSKVNTPKDQIRDLLNSPKDYDRGLGLELLALRMVLDLGLNPRAFRLRSKKSAYAELDLVAEGAHLMFSRWHIQCKCIKGNVSLGDIAKEVGLAIYSRAHVVAVVTTSGFSREALNYTREITQSTHLQFVLIDKSVVADYLDRGASSLVDFVMSNAKDVMARKGSQPIDADGG